MEDFYEDPSKATRRDSKKKSKKNFTPDNRVSVRWLYENTGRKAKEAQKHRLRDKEEYGRI